MAKFAGLLGTLSGYFKIGLSGVRLKNSSGNLLVRNSADNADSAVTASTLNASGDSLIINSDAAGSANDWTLTLSRATAQTSAVTFRYPATNGTNGYYLQTDGSGNSTWAAVSGGTN
jgi:hypothetical protein